MDKIDNAIRRELILKPQLSFKELNIAGKVAWLTGYLGGLFLVALALAFIVRRMK